MNTEPHRWIHRGGVAAVVLALLLIGGCGDDDTDATSDGNEVTTETGTMATTDVTATDPTATGTDTGAVVFEQPAVWPAADVVFDTPEAAANDFVAEVLGVAPMLGEFRQGDSRSGEIEVLFTGEVEGTTRLVRSTLLLRQLGPDSGWFVLGAVSEGASIESPEAGASVPAGAITVSGQGRGFEGNVVVEAFVAGDSGRRLDQQITFGGSLETPEPFSLEVDLSAAEPGGMILLLVRGGVGLETDPGDFAAIPVQIE